MFEPEIRCQIQTKNRSTYHFFFTKRRPSKSPNASEGASARTNPWSPLFLIEKKIETFRWFLTVDIENSRWMSDFGTFYELSVNGFTKYSCFLWVWWFLAKGRSCFLGPRQLVIWKLNVPYSTVYTNQMSHNKLFYLILDFLHMSFS